MLCGEPKPLDPVKPALPGRGRQSAVLAGLGQRQAAVRAFMTSQRVWPPRAARKPRHEQ